MKDSLPKRLGLGVASLALSLMFFATAKSVAYNNSSTAVNRLTETYTHTLDSVPIDIKYNNDDYFISGYSYDVEVYLTSTNRVKLDSEINPDTRSFKVVADLTDVKAGTSKVDLVIKDLPSDVNAEIRPAEMSFTLGKKVSRTFPVQVQVEDDQLGTGYVLKSASLSLTEVEVVSDETTIEQIDHLVAKLPSDTVLTRNYQDSVVLQAVSASGTILPGIITPAKADLTVEVSKLTKTVPVAVELIGELDSSLSNISYELGFSEVIISGSQEALDATDFVTVTIDVTDIKKDTRKTVTLSADNVTVTPEVVAVKLTVTKKN